MDLGYDKIVLSSGNSNEYGVEPGSTRNDIGLYDIPSTTLEILCYLLIPYC